MSCWQILDKIQRPPKHLTTLLRLLSLKTGFTQGQPGILGIPTEALQIIRS
jgi:hypothetical protein